MADETRAKIDAWLGAQNFPRAKVEVTVEPSVAVSKLIGVLTRAEHDVIGQAFVMYHALKSLVVEATRS